MQARATQRDNRMAHEHRSKQDVSTDPRHQSIVDRNVGISEITLIKFRGRVK
jgi:hypothetical protein